MQTQVSEEVKGHLAYNIYMKKGSHHKKESIDKLKKNSFRGSGEKNPFWKGGGVLYQAREAKKRDNYTCQNCGLQEREILVVDHIRSKALRPDLQFVLDNLITLCPNCHARKTLIDIRSHTEAGIFKKKIK